ncbi:MAG: BTAD domain-containing putative transcriptional regulator [Cystobacter sp.]
MLFGRKAPPTRSELVVAADRARSKGKLKRAIQGYRKALELEPKDPTLLGKLAPLLARTNETDAALKSFRDAAQLHLDKGFSDKALAVYTQAAETFPYQVALWQQVSKMHLDKGRRADAIRVLLRGRFALRRKQERPEAIILLKEAMGLEPSLFEPRLDLARLLARQKQPTEALALLEPMQQLTGGQLRQVRWAWLCIAPGPGTAWRWLRAAFTGR